MLKRQRIVITGGSGFIGSFLVEELIKKKFKNIVVMDNDPQPKIGADYVKCDVFKDWSIVRKQIKTGDLVVHLAYSFTTSISGIDRIKDAEKRKRDVRRHVALRQAQYANRPCLPQHTAREPNSTIKRQRDLVKSL